MISVLTYPASLCVSSPEDSASLIISEPGILFRLAATPSLGNHSIIWKLKLFIYKPCQSSLIPNITIFRQEKSPAGIMRIAVIGA